MEELLKTPLDKLIGRVITKIELEDTNQHTLIISTNEGQLSYAVEGDCCSESWFSDIVGIKNLVGAKISRIEEITDELKWYNTDDGRNRQECDSVYGYRIFGYRHDGYEILLGEIIFRNSSNGYYGGSLYEESEIPKDLKLVEIKEDYPVKNPGLNLKLANEIVDMLNGTYPFDNSVLNALVYNRVPCSEHLANHRTIQVVTKEDGTFEVGILGILNGLCGVNSEGYGPIVAIKDESGRISFAVKE